MSPTSPSQLERLNVARTQDPPRPRNKPRGLPVVLADREIFNFASPWAAAAELAPWLGAVHIDVPSVDVDRFAARLHSITLRAVSFSYLDVATPATVSFRSPLDQVLVIVPSSGSAVVTTADVEVLTSAVVAAVINADSVCQVRIEAPMAFVVVGLERRAVEDHLSRVRGSRLGRPLHFSAEFDLSAGTSIRWNLAVQALHAELSDTTSLVARGIGIGQIEDFMIGSLLYCQPSTYSALLDGAVDSARSTVRRAMEFIEQHLAEPIGLDDIAASAGVGSRTLQLHFKADLLQTPMEYLHSRRLDRIRDELRDGSSAGQVTVTDVAARWGISHLGRFAAAYRARFGERPSETLRR